MNILVVGSGGREHALCWKIAQEDRVTRIFAAPGNGGTATEAKTENVDIAANDITALVDFAVANNVDFTVVGPEDPLAGGIVDAFTAKGLRVFGPVKEAARIEASKAFAKQIMLAAGIPTAAYGEFTDFESALAFVMEKGAPIVVKADGLAAGKGVTVAATIDEAKAALEDIFLKNAFGEAGSSVVIEEFLAGEEASYLAFCDGETVLPMVSSQDHKPVFDGDNGPNTGGMGAYSPAPVVTDEVFDFATEKIAKPLIAELKKRGIPFVGIIYAGLMMTEDGPKVLEFNARFGDPETQPVLMRLNSPLLPIFEACVDGTLDSVKAEWSDDATVCVVMASGGYPGAYEKNVPIAGIPAADKRDGTKVFHAGTAEKDGTIVTAGGRVLGVTARHPDLETAIDNAYAAVSDITFTGEHHRNDIGQKALKRK